MTKYCIVYIIVMFAACLWCRDAKGNEDETFRFALPEFDKEYTLPETQYSPPRNNVGQYIDTGALLAALILASWIVLKSRSRTLLYLLMACSVIYFGFWKKGCICPVGVLQNISMALFDSEYGIPLVLTLIFILPLLFTLFFGRTFCGGVCPLGGVQDMLSLKPLKVPGWLEHILGVFPYIYLGLAVLFASLGAGFVVCRYDPYVTLFRFSGNLSSFYLTISFLVIGIFIARPYCRYLCPYGALLKLVSRFTKYHASITPDECVKCRLCEESCPFGAIREPSPEQEMEPRKKGTKRLALMLILLPFVITAGIGVGNILHIPFSKVHHTVNLAEQINLEKIDQTSASTLESDAFRTTGVSSEELNEEAEKVRGKFKTGSIIFGVFVSLVLWSKMFALSVTRKREGYEPDRMKCVSCARCFKSCPREHKRLKELKKDKNG